MGRVQLALVVGFLALGRLAQAAPIGAVVFDNGDLFLGAAALSEVGRTHPVVIADQFFLSSAVTVKGVRFWGSYAEDFPSTGGPAAAPATDNFTVAFYADDDGLPSDVLRSFSLEDLIRTDTGLMHPQGHPIYEYESGFHPFRLKPAGMYWVSIFSDSSVMGTVWIWTFSGAFGSIAYSTDGGPWTLFPDAPETGNLAFQLFGAPKGVPEPGTLLLFSAGLAVVGIRRRLISARHSAQTLRGAN
jgi:hypothetical protein